MNRFADMLSYLRRREGLSQQELAEKLGLAKSTISMYEKGARKPSFEMLEAIADYFNINMDTLVGNDKPASENFTTDEIHMVALYRRADEIDRSSVRHILSRYEDDTPALHLAARGGADLTASPDPARIEAALRETKSETE